ncbi:MAG: hypothetical protein NTY86_15790 [Deltaproteobacteria bacterium]|nr:hypothetical protein [Deltaproteobacteria bacterium]
MAGAAGRVTNRDGEEGVDGVRRVVGEFLGDDGIEGGLDEFLDEGIRGVVGAGGFAGVAGTGGGIGDTREAEDAAGKVEGGDEFEQGLIDGAEFLGSHVPVVDGGAFAGFLVEESAQFAHGGEEVAIGDGGAIEVRALGFREEATEGGQGKLFLAAREAAEDDAEGLPEIGVGIVGGLAEGAVPQPPEGVAGGVSLAGGGIAVWGV